MPGAATGIATLFDRFRAVRRQSLKIVEPLEPDDFTAQSMTEASPAKWHLGHTTWFFETFVLAVAERRFEPFDPRFGFVFNSYYESVGDRQPRPDRGLLTRPTVAEVFAYRADVDERMGRVLESEAIDGDLAAVLEVGLQHEQQHQELMLTDLKHLLAANPLEPVYRETRLPVTAPAPAPDWVPFDGGLVEIGHDGHGFAFDNESPRHRVFLEPYALANRPVTCGEFLAFIEDGGYERHDLWLSDGWEAVRNGGWASPQYWRPGDEGWTQFTLSGRIPVDRSEPVTHVSFYEADAYARWADARLPSEAEWETAARSLPVAGNFVESDDLHPRVAAENGGLLQMFGDVWEWTASAYVAFPGFRPLAGALGEYNGKFMCDQHVLRGGSCASPESHLRASYRNFFHANARWQFSGIRLARDLG